VDGLWATKSEDVGLIVRAISYVVLIHQRYRRHAIARPRALHYPASRGKHGEIVHSTTLDVGL